MTSDVTRHAMGQLLVGGDWACTTGDLETLGYVARCLAPYADEPLRHELITLGAMCRSDPDVSVSVWIRLKQRLLRDDGTPAPA